MCDTITYTYNNDLRDAMQFWHDTLITWVKNPAGGLGDTNHLFALSYTRYDTTDTDYNFLFDNSNIDLTDFHSYRDEKDMGRERYTVFNDYVKQRADKPFHFGECNSWGSVDVRPIDTLPHDYQSTSKYYNNYDISFHNELWSTAMMGCYATGHTWNWPIVHRWPMTNPEHADLSSDNELGDIFSFTPPGSPTVNDTIKSVFHNYMPLVEFFTNNVYLDQELTPKIFYSDSLGVEIYYMVNSTGTSAYGWIHNLNAYWANKYYYSDLFENYYGCTDPLSPPYTLTGFNPNDTLGVYFYPTRMGSQTLPTNYTAHMINDGSFDFDLPDVELGCDSVNADFAFVILPFGHNRIAGHRDEKKKIEKRFDFSIHPNPTEGRFTLTFSIPNPDPAVKVKITVLDVTGRIVLAFEMSEESKYNLDLSNAAKGIYFVRVVKGESEKFQKIVIH